MTNKRKIDYPIGSISHGTMRPEDLIPTFLANLFYNSKVRRPKFSHTIGDVPAKTRKAHTKLALDIENRMNNTDDHEYFGSGSNGYADEDLETLFDALQEYAGPYFYFGAHPGDGSDYGYWLSESFDDDFDGLKVSDLSEVPSFYRGEVLLVNDHGNVSLYVKSARKFREIWSVV